VLHASGFCDVSDNEIAQIEEKAISKSTKDVAKFRVKLFQDLYRIRQENVLNCHSKPYLNSSENSITCTQNSIYLLICGST